MTTRRTSIRSSSSASSWSSASMRWASEEREALVAAVTGSRDRGPAEPGPFGDEGRHREALEAATKLLWGGVAEVAHLDEGFDPGLTGRALGHDEDPDGLDRAVPRLGAAARPATREQPGRLRRRRGDRTCHCCGASWRFGRSTSMTSTPNPAQVASQSGPIGAGAFDADLGDVAKALEPTHQGLVAGRVGGEALRAEQPTERIEGCCNMDVAMGVDSTGDPHAQLLRWSWSSLSLKG